MKLVLYISGILLLSFGISTNTLAQIETEVLNTSINAKKSNAQFFTNRPMIIQEDSSISFKNKTTS